MSCRDAGARLMTLNVRFRVIVEHRHSLLSMADAGEQPVPAAAGGAAEQQQLVGETCSAPLTAGTPSAAIVNTQFKKKNHKQGASRRPLQSAVKDEELIDDKDDIESVTGHTH